ncbi:FecR family protein [Hydrogenivirga caldilitoris]|uniref:FecR family protein n=1 Tax=Hydrogenivirga caldilitoris TaxID=246264 RepID=A0A497XQF9_9AQUI|nr:FecR domain-containing protein [Hydrogenivirga caldilitoris]RLJ70369.1 FecR family protein [Hydrogenivirga caldilitoris]
MRALLVLLVLVLSAFSQEKAGEVVKKQGRVQLFKEGNPRGEVITELPRELFVKDILKTDFGSMAFVKLLGIDKIALLEDSVLYIEGIDRLSFDKGRVVFQIRKRGESEGLKVRVRSVIIGIKGTRFLVDAKGDTIGIFLKDGRLTVRNAVGEFIRYKKREEEEYEEFKRGIEEGIKEERKEYEKFKEETEKEFREFVKEFELEPGSAVIIEGNEVRDVEIPPEVDEEFKLLDMF